MSNHESHDLTGPLLREIADLKRQLDQANGWRARAENEAAGLRAGIDAKTGGKRCPNLTWEVNTEYAAKLECLTAKEGRA